MTIDPITTREASSGELGADGAHRTAFRVYFEDTDFSGVVYHARYLHFLERGRSDFLRMRGIGHRDLLSGAYGAPMAFAVRRLGIEFLRPARIDDVVTVETRVAMLGGARIGLDQRLLIDEVELVTAQVKVAVISPAGKPMRMPPSVIAALRGEAGDPGGRSEPG